MASFSIKRILHVPAPLLWEQLSNFSESSIPGLEVVVERPGDPDRHQVGAIRRLFIGGSELREKLLHVDPRQHRLTYQLLSGAPATRYRGTVTIRPHDKRSALVEWRVVFHPAFPWPARVIAGLGKASVNAILDRFETAPKPEAPLLV